MRVWNCSCFQLTNCEPHHNVVCPKPFDQKLRVLRLHFLLFGIRTILTCASRECTYIVAEKRLTYRRWDVFPPVFVSSPLHTWSIPWCTRHSVCFETFSCDNDSEGPTPRVVIPILVPSEFTLNTYQKSFILRMKNHRGKKNGDPKWNWTPVVFAVTFPGVVCSRFKRENWYNRRKSGLW